MSDIETIKSRLDIVDLVSQYVELKKAGSNYKGLCPFHSEKTPSFMVNPNLQIFKCFGCGRGGDSISFIQEVERLDFPEALKLAAEKAGVELNTTTFKKNKKEEALKKRIIEANTLAARYYHHILKSHKLGKPGRDYANKRLISAKEIEKFMFGYAPNGKKNLISFLTKKGFESNDLINWGLAVERDRTVIDKFRNRLLQPVRNIKGEIIAFSGRYIGDFTKAPKYLNSPETQVFKKNANLYGLYDGKDTIRKQNKAILVEGNIDVVSAHRVGIEYIVAPLGTAFTESQARLLKRFADEVYLAFDTDNAGVAATIRAIEILEKIEVHHKIINLGKFGDIDEMISADPNMFIKTLDNPTNTLEYFINLFGSQVDLGGPDGKSDFLQKILPILKSIQDKIQRKHFTKEIAILTELSTDDIDQMLEKTSYRKVLFNKENAVVPPAIDNPEIKINKLFEYYLSLFLHALQNNFELPYEPNIFEREHSNYHKVFEMLIESNGIIEKKHLQTASSDQSEILKRVTLVDISEIRNIERELYNLWKRLYSQKLKNEVYSIRKQLSIKQSNKLLERISEITEELSKL